MLDFDFRGIRNTIQAPKWKCQRADIIINYNPALTTVHY